MNLVSTPRRTRKHFLPNGHRRRCCSSCLRVAVASKYCTHRSGDNHQLLRSEQTYKQTRPELLERGIGICPYPSRPIFLALSWAMESSINAPSTHSTGRDQCFVRRLFVFCIGGTYLASIMCHWKQYQDYCTRRKGDGTLFSPYVILCSVNVFQRVAQYAFPPHQ